ncbi:hypothetical protein FOMPIDRAFT_1132368 [Fomitopsis schrenkii]|uniref:Chitin-binding type-4 domain-containing protein n=1 Tax=Fomitopsis schrenkii TaxID=2126942 RepID=S8F0X1_FOMSC|nr:hypothetical protein FOMPIDRAFT_1132368 [Fomitopsis schrenkii]
MFTFLACSTLLVFVVCPISAVLVNRTIDDYYGDSASGVKPHYEGSWNYGPECPGCYVQPEKARTFNSSWHDSTTSQKNPIHSVQFSFNGTAIWVYCVVPNHVSKATTFVNISFELDGKDAGHYTHEPDKGSDEYRYNVTVYTNTQLAKVQHKLKMLAGHQGSQNSLFLFDWAEYTP